MIKAPFANVIDKPQPMLNESSYCSSKVMLFIWNNDCKISATELCNVMCTCVVDSRGK